MAGEILLDGIMVGGLDEGGGYAPVADGTGDVCVDDVHDPASYYICKIGRMAFADNLKATEVFVVFHLCTHRMTRLLERNIRLQA